MEVPSESFHTSSSGSRTCYPRRAFNQKLTDRNKKEATIKVTVISQVAHILDTAYDSLFLAT